MHMADALISPIVGSIMLVAVAGTATYSIKKMKDEVAEKKIPLMGVMGAFIFAAQMINFSIPGTGSSGHIGGGMILAILLGPFAGFLTMLGILLIQALFFGDGGLLAYGCNVMNLGFFTCFIAYPVIYRKILSKGYTRKRIFIGSILAVVIGIQLGSFSVVLQTFLSEKTDIPFTSFLLFMQPIHLAIGLIEGVITASIVAFIWKQRPEIITGNISRNRKSYRKTIITIIIATVFVGGVLSWYASEKPDGLEWSIFKVTNKEEVEIESGIYEKLSGIQEMVSIMPDYTVKNKGIDNIDEKSSKIAQNAETSIAGLLGGVCVLIFALLFGFLVKAKRRRDKAYKNN